MKRLFIIVALLSAPAWAYTYVNSAGFTPSGSTATLTYSCTAGDALVVVAKMGGAFTSFQPTDMTIQSSSALETFNKVGQTKATNNGSTAWTTSWVYWTPSCVGGSQTYTGNFDASGSGSNQQAIMVEFSGLAYDHVPNVISSFASQENSSPNNFLQTGSITTTVTTFQIVYGVICYDSSQNSTSTGYTLALKVDRLTVLYAGSVSAGTVNPTVQESGSGNNCMHVGVIAFGAETYPTSGFAQDSVGWNYNSTPFSTAVSSSPKFNVKLGNTLYVGIGQNSTNNNPTVVSTLGNTCSSAYVGNLHYLMVYSCPVTVAGAETITVTPAFAVNGLTVEVLEYVGYGTTIDAQGDSGSLSNFNPVVASLTSTHAAAIVSFMVTGATATWPVHVCTSGLTVRSYSSSAALGLSAYDELEGAGGTFSNSCSSVKADQTTSSGINFLDNIIAFTVAAVAQSGGHFILF